MNRRRWTKWTLGTRLVVGYIVTLVIPFVILAGILLQSGVNRLNRQAEETTQLLVELKVAEINQTSLALLHSVEGLILEERDLSFYQRIFSEEDMDSSTVRDVLQTILDRERSIHHVWFYDRQATIVIAQQGSETVNLSAQELAVLNTTISPALSTIYRSQNDDPLVDVIVPIRDEVGAILGHVVVTVNLSLTRQDNLPDLRYVIQNQPAVSAFPAAYIGLFDVSGKLLISSQPNQPLFQTSFDHPGIQNARVGTGMSKVEVARYESVLQDSSVVGASSLIEDLNWIVVAELEESNILDSLRATTVPQLVTGLGVLLLLHALWGVFLRRSVEIPLRQIRQHMNWFALEESSERLMPVQRDDELGALHNAFIQMSNQIHDMVSDMHARHGSQSQGMVLMQTISRRIQAVTDREDLLEELLLLLCEQIESVDYAQIFVVDSEAHKASLHTATGDLGRQLLARNHHCVVQPDNLIGRAVLSGQSVVVADLSESFQRWQSDVLAEMRAELVVPVRHGGHVTVVLDVHSKQPGVFSNQNLVMFEVIAAQIGLVVRTRHEAERSDGRERQQDRWGQMRQRAVAQDGVLVAQASTEDEAKAASDWTALQRHVMVTGQVAKDMLGAKVAFAVPVKLRGEVIGAVEWLVEAGQFSQDLVQIAEELVNRLALAVDNAQLFEQSQRMIDRERMVNEITQKLTTQTDVRQILQVAVRELGQALGTPETQISLNIARNQDT